MILPRLILQWPAEWFELYTERCGIMEFEGGLSKKEAEKLAEQDVRKLAEEEVGTQMGLEMKWEKRSHASQRP